MDDPLNHDAQASFERAHLGRGWAFPVSWRRAQPEPGEAAGQAPAAPAPRRVAVAMSDRLTDIQESIRIILETPLGERVMQPEFGSEVHRYMFAAIGPQTKADLAEAVRRALVVWERRVRDVAVRVSEHLTETSRLDVEISFRVDTHRMRQSLIFPFYVNQPGGQ